MHLSDLEYLHPFWRYSLSNFEVIRNCTKFCMFLVPKIILCRDPKILDQNYKIEHISETMQNFMAIG